MRVVHGLVHMKKVVDSGKRRLTSCSNTDINLSARRLLLLAVVRPTLEYGSEVWEANKTQAAALESVMLGGAKRFPGCLSRTCNEAVWGIWDWHLYRVVGIRPS